MKHPTQERLSEVFNYNPNTGLLSWRKQLSNRVPIGRVAGSQKYDGGPQSTGHIQVGVDNGNYNAHTLIWIMMTAAAPPDGFEVDHIDQDGTNNQWENLRLVTRMSNMENVTKPNSHNKSGYRGVDFHTATGRWRSSIRVQRKQKCLGYFDTAEAAHGAYLKAKTELHPAWNRDLLNERSLIS